MVRERSMTPNEIAEALEARHKYDKINYPPASPLDRQAAATIRELEAGRAKWESGDGLDGSVVHAVREVLNRANVPTMAFIDDHVALLVQQRDAAETKLKIATEALESAKETLLIEIEALSESEHSDANDSWPMLHNAEVEIEEALARIKEV